VYANVFWGDYTVLLPKTYVIFIKALKAGEKHMRKCIKKVQGLLIFILLSVFLTGCASMNKLMEDGACDRMFEEVMECLERGDADTVYAMMEPEVQTPDFQEGFDELLQTWQPEEYTYQKIGRRIHSMEQEKYIKCTYRIDTKSGKRYEADVIRKSESEERLYGFYLRRVEVFSGYFSDIGHFSPAQWGIFFVGIVLMVPSWFCAADCLKRKIKWKPLWVIFILLFYVGIRMYRVQGNIGMNFLFGTIRFSRLLLSDMGGFQISVFFPAGALIYLILRKSLEQRQNSTDTSSSR